MGRMGVSAACTPSPSLNDQPEYFGFWPGEPFPLGAFEKYADDFKDQYFRISERQRAGSEQRWEPTVEMIEGEYWRIVEQATDQIEVETRPNKTYCQAIVFLRQGLCLKCSLSFEASESFCQLSSFAKFLSF